MTYDDCDDCNADALDYLIDLEASVTEFNDLLANSVTAGTVISNDIYKATYKTSKGILKNGERVTKYLDDLTADAMPVEV